MRHSSSKPDFSETLTSVASHWPQVGPADGQSDPAGVGASLHENRTREFLSASLARAELTVVGAAGVWLHLSDGRRLLDFCSGTMNLPLGYGHPAIIAAASRQLATGLYFHSSRFGSPPYLQVAQLLHRLVPTLPVVHHKICSGSDANETAIKIARKYTGRRLVATQLESHLGETCETHAASGRDIGRKGSISGSDDFLHFESPTGSPRDVDAAREALAPYKGKVAAILVEPVPLRAGLLVFPSTGDYLGGLRELAIEHQALLIFDEIQTFGWIDSLLATKYFTAAPDLVTLAKGIGFGFPLAASAITQNRPMSIT